MPGVSSDDQILPVADLPPDPFLGEFVEGDVPRTDHRARTRVPRHRASRVVRCRGRPRPRFAFRNHRPRGPDVPSAGSFDALQGPAIPPATVAEEEPVRGTEPVSSDAFPALDLSAPPTARPEAGKTSEVKAEDEDEEEEEDLPPRGTPWLTVLLASINSALILFLIWHF